MFIRLTPSGEVPARSSDDRLVGQQVFAGEATRLGCMTEEAQEGRDAFVEKRPKDFSCFPRYY